jgi:hypothetical protein
VIRGSRGSSGSICGGERFAGKRLAATPPNRVLDAETLAAAERVTSGPLPVYQPIKNHCTRDHC